jgi:hypothetical protein
MVVETVQFLAAGKKQLKKFKQHLTICEVNKFHG